MSAPRQPQDRLPKQSEILAAEAAERPEGAELLRLPIDVDFDEEAEFLAVLSKLKIRGDTVSLTTTNISALGSIAKHMQNVLAVNSVDFRAWTKAKPFTERAGDIAILATWYAGELGEGDSSAS